MPTARKTADAKPEPGASADDQPKRYGADDVDRGKVQAAQAKAGYDRRIKEVWGRLAAPFGQDDLEKLPKPLKARDDNKGRCEPNSYYSADGHACGGWHARSVHLDYVGHAGITQRLNDVLGPQGWDFMPMALTPEGLPIMSREQFWGALTIRVEDQEVTKYDVAANYNGPQEAWGDALRRCAMRFGVGTYLWSKSEAALALKMATDRPPAAPPEQEQHQSSPDAQHQAPSPQDTQAAAPHVIALTDRLNTLDADQTALIRSWWSEQALPFAADLTPEQAALVAGWVDHLENQAAQDPH